MDALIVASRFLHVAALAALFGLPLFRLAVSREPGAGARHAKRWAAALALVSALGWLLGVAADMSESFAQALEPEIFGAVLTETRFGQIWLGRLALAAVLAAWLFAPASEGRRGDWVTLALAGALTASLAAVGHAATGALAPLHVAADAAHLLAGMAWIGGLVALAAMLSRGRGGDSLRALLQNFSRLGTLAVVVLVLSGVVNTALILPGPSALVTSAYGRVLLVKLALVAIMIALAALNRFVLAPRIAQGEARSSAALAKSVALELGLGLAVLALVARLGTLAPAG